MSEQMTIRERLDWLAEDRGNRVLRIHTASVYAMSASNNVYGYSSREWIEPSIIASDGILLHLNFAGLFLDEKYTCTKLYRPVEKSELEKAEEELLQAKSSMKGNLLTSEYDELDRYIEARLKVERLKKEDI